MCLSVHTSQISHFSYKNKLDISFSICVVPPSVQGVFQLKVPFFFVFFFFELQQDLGGLFHYER